MTELSKRAVTSIVLLTLLAGAYWFLSPMQLAIAIAGLYSYAFALEYLPLARQSIRTSPLATVFAGIALVLTGLLHGYWASDPSKHILLGLSILTAVLSDMGGYIFGNLFGKHLLAPTISPKKTWEGLIGSIVLTSTVLYIITYLCCPACNLFALYMGTLGAYRAVAALLGDLLFSYLKRAAGVKDTGNLLPGHGGMLDRLDSIVGTTMAWLIMYALLRI
jgi:phosphatidate cytidylyltransferase